MTNEQIAELRKWCNSDSYDTPDSDAILKALDEREALLEALKSAADAIAGEWGESSAQDLRDVIAKAEAP